MVAGDAQLNFGTLIAMWHLGDVLGRMSCHYASHVIFAYFIFCIYKSILQMHKPII